MTFDFPLDKLAQDPDDVVAWHLFLCYPNGVLTLPPCGKTTWHNEMDLI
jgi:predicted ester cyclase